MKNLEILVQANLDFSGELPFFYSVEPRDRNLRQRSLLVAIVFAWVKCDREVDFWILFDND